MSMSAVLDVLQRPRIVRLSPRLYAVIFDQIKIVLARHLLTIARTTGEVDTRSEILESTSGSMGLALALACREHTLPLTIVSDDGLEPEILETLRSLGAGVSIVRGPFGAGGPQGARIARVLELASQARRAFWVRQYDNPAAPGAYHAIADEIHDALGPVDCLVGPVGTGASMCGLTTRLRARGCETRLVAVDTHGSVLFGHPSGSRLLRGLGNSIHPANLRHDLVDECHWVAADEAFAATRALHAGFGIDAGPTSGAAFLVAAWLERATDTGRIAFVCPDRGERYRRTVLDEGWLRARGVWRAEPPSAPHTVADPRQCPPSWSRMTWERRTLAEVLAREHECGT